MKFHMYAVAFRKLHILKCMRAYPFGWVVVLERYELLGYKIKKIIETHAAKSEDPIWIQAQEIAQQLRIDFCLQLDPLQQQCLTVLAVLLAK